MIYWYGVDPERPDDLEVGLRNSLWGVPEEAWDRIEPVEPGDSVLFYHRDHGFVLCDVDSEPYTESIPVWSDVDYPHRIRLSDPVETDRYANIGEIHDCLVNRETGEPFEGPAEVEVALEGAGGMFRPLTDDEVRCLFGRLGWGLPAGVSPPPEPEEPEEAEEVEAEEPVEPAGEPEEPEEPAEAAVAPAPAEEPPGVGVRGRRVILAPAAGNTASQERYADTITEGVELDLLEAFLPGPQMDVLREALGSHQAHVWGTPPAQDHANRTQWEASGPGDVILFTGGGHVFASASVILTRQDESLAEELWGRREDGSTWKFLYFVTAPVEQDVPYDELNAVAGYEPAYRIPRLNVLAPERSGRVLDAFPGFAVPRPSPGAGGEAAAAEGASAGGDESAAAEGAADEEEPPGEEATAREAAAEPSQEPSPADAEEEEPPEDMAPGETPVAGEDRQEAEPEDEEAGPADEGAGPEDEGEEREDEGAGPEAEAAAEPADAAAAREEAAGAAEPPPAAPAATPSRAAGADVDLARLRDLLFGQRDLRRCGLCGRLLPVDLLEVVFVKPLEACTEIETMDLENDVLAACGLGCAALFREGFLVVDDGVVAAGRTEPRTEPVDEYVEELAGNQCEFWHAGSEGYFRWHAREIGGA